jgi:putative Ca2+/H+ antiporter (TMEM165/GDT1 family)
MEKIQLSTIAISSEAHKLIKVHAAQTNMLIRDVVEVAVREYIEKRQKENHVGKR